jgi:cytochrome c553
MAALTKKQKIFLGISLVFLLLQLVQPNRKVEALAPDKDLIAMTNPPAEVAAMLKAACYDCHSNMTEYPFYSYITPLSFWIQGHVNNGRRKVNFSNWGNYDAGKQAKYLEESSEEVVEKKMPLKSYTWGHSAAKLTDSQRKILAEWFNAQRGGTPKTEHQDKAEDSKEGDDD